jgi:hypothetical protein
MVWPMSDWASVIPHILVSLAGQVNARNLNELQNIKHLGMARRFAVNVVADEVQILGSRWRFQTVSRENRNEPRRCFKGKTRFLSPIGTGVIRTEQGIRIPCCDLHCKLGFLIF